MSKGGSPGASQRRGLQFLGATGTVTGSKYLLRAGGNQLLVDCGLFQGYKQLRLRNWAPLPLKPAAISAVVLTHAHIDHSGYLPLLARNGFTGKVYCSEGTRDLCHVMLPDAGRLQEEEAEYANRRGFSRHKPAKPLYTERDAKRALALLHPVDFSVPVDVSGMTLNLFPTGHILGASIASLEHGGVSRFMVINADEGKLSGDQPDVIAGKRDQLAGRIQETYGVTKDEVEKRISEWQKLLT